MLLSTAFGAGLGATCSEESESCHSADRLLSTRPLLFFGCTSGGLYFGRLCCEALLLISCIGNEALLGLFTGSATAIFDRLTRSEAGIIIASSRHDSRSALEGISSLGHLGSTTGTGGVS
jgi:hypothetical protein